MILIKMLIDLAIMNIDDEACDINYFNRICYFNRQPVSKYHAIAKSITYEIDTESFSISYNSSAVDIDTILEGKDFLNLDKSCDNSSDQLAKSNPLAKDFIDIDEVCKMLAERGIAAALTPRDIIAFNKICKMLSNLIPQIKTRSYDDGYDEYKKMKMDVFDLEEKRSVRKYWPSKEAKEKLLNEYLYFVKNATDDLWSAKKSAAKKTEYEYDEDDDMPF